MVENFNMLHVCQENFPQDLFPPSGSILQGSNSNDSKWFFQLGWLNKGVLSTYDKNPAYPILISPEVRLSKYLFSCTDGINIYIFFKLHKKVCQNLSYMHKMCNIFKNIKSKKRLKLLYINLKTLCKVSTIKHCRIMQWRDGDISKHYQKCG